MEIFARELRFALRRLAARPGSTAVAIATLAIGIGAAVAIFSLWDALLLRPLGYRAPDRLMAIWEREGADRDLLGWQTVDDWRRRSHAFSDIVAQGLWMPTVTGESPERLVGLRVGPGYFEILGVEPALGRAFLPEEDVRGKNFVAILTDGLWRRRFGADPAVLGREIPVGAFRYRIVGVLPPDFEPPLTDAEGYPGIPEVFTPLAYNASLPYACRTCHHLHVLGRLAPGVSLAAASSELDALGKDLARRYPAEYNGGGAIVEPLREALYGSTRPLLAGLLAAVGLLLLLATANLASMQLAAAIPRGREMAVRRALGARSIDLARLLGGESLLLGLGGALAGAVIARGLLRVAFAFAPETLVRLRTATIDARALAVAIGLGLFSALLFGLLPTRIVGKETAAALSAARGSISDRGRRRTLGGLVAVDVALAVVLLAGAVFVGDSLRRLLDQPPGFEIARILTMDLSVGGSRPDDALAGLYERLVAGAREIPGVADAAVASQVPLSGSVDGYGVHPEKGGAANPELDPAGDLYAVSPSYLATIGVPLVAGRGVEASDRAGAPPVVLVSRALARRLAPEGNALGSRVKVGGMDGPWRTIVGIVGDVRHRGLEATSPGAVYLPIPQWPNMDSDVSLVVRAAKHAPSLAAPLREIVRREDRETAIARVATMDDLVARGTARRRFLAWLVGGFAAAALLLAMLGVEGVVAHAVAERRRELGLRRALGATGPALLATLYGRLATVVGIGATAGLGGALAFGRALASQLYEVRVADPRRLALVALALLAVAAVAAIGPARRALAVDPAQVLREE